MTLMRVCLVSQEYPPETARGGIGSQTWNKAQALAERGHIVHVLSASVNEGPPLRTEIDRGVTVHRLRPPLFKTYTEHTFWLGYSWAVLEHLQKLIVEHKYDVIDVAEYGAEGFIYQLDRTEWNWVPVVVQLHGPLALMVDTLGWPEQGSDFATVGAWIEGISIRKADALMACSANIADFTARYYDLDRASIDVVHCGVDAQNFTPADRSRPSDSAPVVLFVGNLAKSKGLKTAVDAVLRLRSSVPNIRMEILGAGDEDAVAALRNRITEAGAENEIEVVGFVADRAKMPDYYRRAAVLCSPAEHEMGVANVYIEAMACGCPIIAANTGGAPEAVTDGETGFLVSPGDVDATARALSRIIGEPAAGRRMGEAARRRVDAYFAMNRYIERVLSTYDRAIRVAGEKRDRQRRDGLR
jgi:glycosyltransferase involved in cell wall biosynthesis